MSEPFLKSLECSCVKGTSVTCPGGGELSATMTLQAGALSATIVNDSKITSPGEQQLCYAPRANDVQVIGDGPYYVVKFLDFTGGFPCDGLEVSPGWTLRSFGGVYDSIYQVVAINNDNSLLVYGTGSALSAKPNDNTLWTTQLYGIGHSTKPNITITKSIGGADLTGNALIETVFSAEFPLSADFEASAQISEKLIAAYTVSQVLTGECDFTNTITDKVAGEFGDFYCQGKLYPSGDLPIDAGFGAFSGPLFESYDLWNNINEGIYEGVLKDGGDSNLLSDDNNSYIEPNTIHTEGFFQYKCELTELYVRPEYSSFRIRVAAPLFNFESKLPPLYTLYNIRLSDPSGNLIIKYNDIQIRGDSTDQYLNFATYSSLPQINVITDKYDWERSIPHMQNVSGYQLAFSVRAVSLDDPFNPGFDEGFEENYIIPETFYASGNNYLALDGQPLSTQEYRFINPTRGFKISAVEICNSGGYGPRLENFLPFNMPVREIGRRLERSIKPTFMPLNTYDTTIYPAVNNNIWTDDTNIIAGYPLGVTNQDTCGAQELVNILNVKNIDRFIKLQTATGGGVADSGKLILKFQTGYSKVDEITNGDFNFSFDQGTQNIWWKPSGAFNVEKRNPEIQEDISFYDVESITLKVMAKKAIGSRNYILDVVGYSNDHLLGVTPASGGFIQDPSGVFLNDTFVANVGNHPVLSGFYNDNSDWTMGGSALSERDDYFQASGNDHYKLAQYPVVTGTDFALYEVPLVILDDNVRLGAPRDYSVSSFLEHLYLDIYPLPSGAAIAYAELCVRYAPANALNLHTQGGANLGKTQDGRPEAALFPSGMQSYDNILNAGSGYAPISRIADIPHAYSSPNTIKTNYARRWRGLEGLANGDFHPNHFDFSFYNPLLDYPFNFGFYDFDYDEGHTINPRNSTGNSGILHTTYGNGEYRYKNIGWRFTGHTIFNDQLPGYSGDYQTTDWTSLSSGSVNFTGDALYGQIADAFNNIVRISGKNSYIDFDHTIDISGGFTAYLKFTPDINVSGVGYNLFNSGVLVSKWGRHNTAGGKQLEFAIAYESGYLCGLARDTSGNIIKVTDTAHYSEYQYPLPVILTYNDNGLSGLKLYTDNEFAYPWTTLRASSAPFDIYFDDSDVVVGFSTGSGVGMNMFVSEFGLASGCKIVQSDANLQLKETTADVFLANQRVKWFDPSESHTRDRYTLWNNVDEDTYNDWRIGDFKYCQFDASFDFLKKRTGRDLISFNIINDGLPYSQKTNLALPTLINSGVSYHTQIENDFLRFHLSDVPNNFYAVNKRITKNIPVGYKFSERALVVETVLEHKFGDGIKWESCEDIPPSGPKMIVSLYTKKQEPYWTTDESNWGLVNRKSHYIEPSSCLIKLESTFDYEDLLDTTEAWSIFPKEPRLKDFTERYFKDDVNQMFVQYDLVYPSGPAFESRIDMHSSHVRMADANIFALDSFGNMHLNVSGGFPVSSQINLNIGGFPRETSGILPLTIQVPIPYGVLDETPSGFHLNISGAFPITNSLNLFIPPQSGYSYFNLSISGELPSGAFNNLSLSMPKVLGAIDTSDDKNPYTTTGSFFGMPLTLYNVVVSEKPTGPVLNLNLFAASGDNKLLSALPILLYNQQNNTNETNASGIVNLKILGHNRTISSRTSNTMPMYINSPNIIDTRMPLYLHSPITESLLTGTVNLVTASYSSDFGSSLGLWNNNNYGVNIDLQDNHAAFLPVSNEIRGVDLMAYGSCTGDSISKAIDQALITDCTVWREETCNDGGIFRAKATYTNSGAINFEGGFGYSGNYYGIRKYDQLLPSLPYKTTMVIKTGSTEAIPVPRTFEEWEYGMCGPAWNASGCCTEDCEDNIVFSGVKLVGDDACGVPPSSNLCVDPSLIVASGRNKNDNYGQSVRVKGDLMAISAPNITVPDYSPYDNCTVNVSGAGAVFLYRRGDDEAGKKATWSYLEQLMLPSGFRKDYIQRTTNNLLKFDQFSVSGNKWQIGQEGRKFGESLDICSSGSREVVVVGAPRAKWSREFNDIVASSIPTAGMIFVDLFKYDKTKLQSVAATAEKFNVLWKYFSAPWNPGPNEWYAQINPKLIVLQLKYSNRSYPIVPTDESSWFVHRYLPRLDDLDLLFQAGSGLLGGSGSYAELVASGKPIVFNDMFNIVKDAFFTAFPSGSTIFPVYSGIPAIIGMFKEQTGSTAGALQYADKDGNVFNIYNEFEKFYLAHSYASGVRDFVQNIAQSGHLNTIVGKSEQWDVTSKLLLSETFDSGRLSTTYTNTTLNRNFIASGVGQEWGSTHGTIVSQFQTPPASGGRVYIFEKERDNFNCIQVIVSPNDESEFLQDPEDSFGATYSRVYNDRFGHSVSISDNGEIIAVGSPWNDKSCRIFERNNQEIQKVYDRIREWCVNTGKTYAVNHYDTIATQSGVAVAKVSTYDFIQHSDRFAYRNDIDFWSVLPTPYKLSYRYGYDDIAYVGTRKFLVDEFAPTSRLGWSSAVDEDGEIVAFGAPTDSLNQFEDVNVWGDGLLSWASYVNAGAVRVFQNRRYYPHDKVVEFGRFGNLDRSTHTEERNLGFYDNSNWPLIFASGADGTTRYTGKSWRRMGFSEIEIPQDAGLAFIITPELDAASDEIIQNIKDWLALGDRNLVLVGNDPVWEENGLYEDSNRIINKILERLGSRMRIHPARDITYSMQECVTIDDLNQDKYNATQSFLPDNSAGRTIEYGGKYYVKGVGDIRIDLSRDNLDTFFEALNCPEGATCGSDPPPIINTKCEFPLKGLLGDLRAEWNEQCIKSTEDSCSVVSYKRNWPFQFTNFVVDCDDPPPALFQKPDQEPVPVLTTAEHLPPVYWYNAANSGLICDYYQPMRWVVSNRFEEKTYFADHNINELAFNIQENGESTVSGNFIDFYYNGGMFDPSSENGRDGILQATGTVESLPVDVTDTVYPDHIFALVESGRKIDGTFNNSRVYILASQWSEDDASRGITHPTMNDDKNTEFYINMVRKNCNTAPKGIQINGFTARTSLNNAYYLSGDSTVGHSLGNKLNVEFISNGGFFRENQEIRHVNDDIDFVWLAFPSGKPSEADLAVLNSWLDTGNKKIIITYNSVYGDQAQQTADNISYLCSGLRLTSRPMFLPRSGRYHIAKVISSYDPEDNKQIVNYATDSISGCDDGYSFTFPSYQYATSVSGIEFNPGDLGSDALGETINHQAQIVPLSGGQHFERIISFGPQITETYKVYGARNSWTIDGGAAVTFPIQPGSGYRVWVNWVSETPYEKFGICLNTSGINAEGSTGGGSCGGLAELNKTTTYAPNQIVFNFKTTVASNTNKFGLIFDTAKWSDFIDTEELNIPLPPSTPRILSISGALLPIITEINTVTTSGLVPDGPAVPFNCRYKVNPATSGTIPGISRPVKHQSSLYCPDNQFTNDECMSVSAVWGDELIEDGPVIVAEEFENFSSFQNGARRSKIILITDSTLLQGQCPHYRSTTITGNQSFVRNLYPASPSGVTGRNWEFAQKLRAPERGSPAKYAAISGSAIGPMLIPSALWGFNGFAGNLSGYSDNEDTYNPTTLNRPSELKTVAEIQDRKTEFFQNEIAATYGIYPRFSGDFLDIANYKSGIYVDYDALLGLDEDTNRDFILDGNIGGGLTELMKIEGTDYLDYDTFNSGCPGDLFGYAIALSNGKMIVGAPYNAFDSYTAISGVSGIVQWHEIKNGPSKSGVAIGADGGAGAAFIFAKTNQGKNVLSEALPWQFIQKVKPNHLNVGIYDFGGNPVQALTNQRGPHQITDSGFITEHARHGDRFGFAVDIACDMAVVGAPNHAFDTLHHHIYSGSIVASGSNTAFQRKSFDAQFDIPQHSFYDLADSGIRVDLFGNNSGVMILNNGAVYNYRNEIVDFQARTQQWKFAEKLFAAGYNSRVQSQTSGVVILTSGSDNDNFGKSISIDRAFRGDSDYTLVVGSPRHDWPTSGNHPTKGLNDAGAAYTFDCMLRQQIPSIPNSGGWIDAHVFGNKQNHSSTDRIALRVYQNTSGNSLEYKVSGILITNANGDVFLEVSGFDPSSKGFVSHRPYVDRIEFELFPGVETNKPFNLVTSGGSVPNSGKMNLSLLGANQANVYNNLGLYHFGVSGLASGEMPSGLSLFISAPSGPISESLNLSLTSTQTTNALNLRTRGY